MYAMKMQNEMRSARGDWKKFIKEGWQITKNFWNRTSYGLDFEAMAKEEENRMDYENQENEFKSDEVLVEGLQQFKELNIHSQFNM